MKCGHAIITDGCKECRALEDEWYEKTKINDIEERKYKERPLKSWHSYIFKNVDLVEVENTLEYYDKAFEVFYRFTFKNNIERYIWYLHCKGYSRLKIEKAIRGTSFPYKQSTIRNFIKELENEIEW